MVQIDHKRAEKIYQEMLQEQLAKHPLSGMRRFFFEQKLRMLVWKGAETYERNKLKEHKMPGEDFTS